MGIEDFDLFDHAQVLGKPHALFAVDLPLKAVLDVFSGQFAKFLVKLYTLAKIERPDQTVVRYVPFFR